MLKIDVAVKKAKIKLIKKANKTGVWENFGVKEVQRLRDQFKVDPFKITPERAEIDDFERWCLNADDLTIKENAKYIN